MSLWTDTEQYRFKNLNIVAWGNHIKYLTWCTICENIYKITLSFDDQLFLMLKRKSGKVFKNTSSKHKCLGCVNTRFNFQNY